jgi:hypothetical protein
LVTVRDEHPSEGSVIGSPSPRNDSVASSAIAAATWTVATTIIGAAVRQQMPKDVRDGGNATHRAASMYLLALSTSAALRTVRA